MEDMKAGNWPGEFDFWLATCATFRILPTEVYWTVLAVQSMATLAAPATFCVASFA
jgi:hypothetical protein